MSGHDENDAQLSALMKEVARSPDAKPALSGRAVGRYVLEERIGRGGMGEVWRARDARLDRTVAVKLIAFDLLDDDTHRARFLREARATAALVHPSLCAVYDVDEHEGVPFIAMELVPGESLRALLLRARNGKKPLSRERAREIALDIAAALACAHDAGVVHRDVKPENIRVLPDGRAKLIDFGLARFSDAAASSSSSSSSSSASPATATGAVLGTARYMSPEQTEGKPANARSDVFSFGIVLHEMLSGAWPWPGGSDAGVAAAILRDDPAPLPSDVDGALARIAERCLAKEPGRRYASGREIVAALDAASAARPSPTSSRLRVARVAAALVGVIVLGLAVAFVAPTLVNEFRPTAVRPPTQLIRLTDTPGHEYSPALSPDGKSVVFAVPRSGGQDLFLLRVGGTKSTRIVEGTGTEASDPEFSPDGSLIAYTAYPAGGDSEIWVMGATGESKRKLTAAGGGSFASWSADSKEIFFAGDYSEPTDPMGANKPMRAVDVATGEVRTVVDSIDALEPDVGKNGVVAFWSRTRAPVGARDLFAVDMAGGEPWALTDDDATDFSPNWAADGRSIYFLSDRSGVRNIWRLPVDARGRRAGEPSAVTVGTEDMRDLDVAAGRAVFSVDVWTTTLTVWEIDDSPLRLARPRIAYSAQRRFRSYMDVADDGAIVVNTFGADEDVLYIAPDGEQRMLTRGGDTIGAFFVEGGARVAYQHSPNYGDRVGLRSVAVDGSAMREHTNDNWNFTTSHDGTRAIYAPKNLDADGKAWLPRPRQQPELRILDLTLPDAERARESTRTISLPEGKGLLPWDWAPDGRHLLAHGADGAVIFDLEDESRTSIDVIDGSVEGFFRDAAHVLVARERSLSIRDLESGSEIQLYETGDEAPRMGGVALSHDGKRLLISTHRREGDIWMLELAE